ncbi:MAG TPA: hypothetical protein ENJ93_04805 [Chloroflexi bacterium]|nr:hypothetical protein [Chloroflexota bacterium]
MTAKYQIIYWRDIPAQVKMKIGRKRSSRPLSARFMAAVDAAAMQAGLTDSDGYMAEWRMGDCQEIPGEPEAFAEALVAQLEADYPGDRLRQMVKQGGWEA